MKKLLSAFVSVLMLMSLSCAGETSADDQAEEELVSAATADTRFSAEDGALLQSYLLGRPVETDLSGKNYDLNGNDRWDVFDLCLLKEQIEAQPAEEPQSDTIVVYFSRTGNTEKIANYLLEITGADSYVIQAAVPYSDEDIAYNNSSCRADQEQNDKTVRPEIADPISSLDGYDTVFLGYPIWWGEEPRIIDTFLESYDLSEKTVIPFCTSGSSGISVSEKI
ncbi:MAG TPA: flavodoxin [Ruminococcus sp.]|nr:flavodoxin [Ruminococcus sp.]